VQFRVAALTNLTQDHLDFHHTMAAYARAKARLFTELRPDAVVLNVDDEFGRQLVRSVRAPVVRVSAGKEQREADISLQTVHLDRGGLDLTAVTPAGEVRISSRLIGAHNVENLLVALGIAHALGLDIEGAARALSAASAPPGRLERCDAPGDAVVVVVDYAHTPDALARALDAVRAIAPGHIWCVFGCGGDRDPFKRAPMGETVGRRADFAVVTSDNPRTEDPRAIAASVVAGVRAAGREPIVELDRAKAIDFAVRSAARGDLVLIAGKGHEQVQIVGNEKHPFSDRVHATGALQRRRDGLGETGAVGQGIGGRRNVREDG
jgi:UDP-N-acetylmuramoyl-L-alanyl-D-glutamate--2,6-diaminopimelate ligase